MIISSFNGSCAIITFRYLCVKLLAIRKLFDENYQQAFDVPELKALLQKYNREELDKKQKVSEQIGTLNSEPAD